MRIWIKEWKSNHLMKDMVVENYKEDTRTHKVFDALEEACYTFDLGRPIWLDSTIADFKRDAKTRFYGECFIEEIPFDYLELEVLEEDY